MSRIERVGGEHRLVSSADGWKDQTYFLFTLDPAVLSRLMFPIGDLTKPEVRRVAGGEKSHGRSQAGFHRYLLYRQGRARAIH